MNNKDIYYIVRLDLDKLFNDNEYSHGWNMTTINKDFCGKLINNDGARFFFELNGSDALVIIPHRWIKWMAPSKILCEAMRNEQNKKSI